MSRTLVLISLLVLASVAAVSAGAKSGGAPYTTDHDLWRAADGGFASWSLDGVALASGGVLRSTSQPPIRNPTRIPAAIRGTTTTTAASYLVGEAVSPEIAAAPFTEAIPSWNAVTPDGSWVETQIRAHVGDHWTKWYTAGPWASGTGTSSVTRSTSRPTAWMGRSRSTR